MLRYSLRCQALAGQLALAAPIALPAQSPCPRGALPAYAHNDYENARPLADALRLGFRGAEADVFLVNGVLRVGHDRRAARTGGSLEDLYLAPLRALVARCGKLTADGGPFFLALEVKETSAATHDSLVALLTRYHALLEAPQSAGRGTPPVHAVLVGWHPMAPPSDSAARVRIGWQHRITKDDRDHPTQFDTRVRLLSLDYGKTMGRWWVREAGRRRWLARLRELKSSAPDRLLRVHNVPVDARIYAELLEAGVDLIGSKQLEKTATLLAVPPVAGDEESARRFVQSFYDWYAPPVRLLDALRASQAQRDTSVYAEPIRLRLLRDVPVVRSEVVQNRRGVLYADTALVLPRGTVLTSTADVGEGGCRVYVGALRLVVSSCPWLPGFSDHQADIFARVTK